MPLQITRFLKAPGHFMRARIRGESRCAQARIEDRDPVGCKDIDQTLENDVDARENQ